MPCLLPRRQRRAGGKIIDRPGLRLPGLKTVEHHAVGKELEIIQRQDTTPADLTAADITVGLQQIIRLFHRGDVDLVFAAHKPIRRQRLAGRDLAGEDLCAQLRIDLLIQVLCAVADYAHTQNPDCLVIVDNTFSTPLLVQPLKLGADVVVHGAAKYLNGHGDAMGGAICTSDEQLYLQFQRMMGVIGCCMSPFNSFLIMRGIQTLPLRMERHCDNAEALVAWLAKQPHVYNLTYPGLAEHPQHALAKRQLKRFGGMLGFQLACDHGTLYNVILKELRLFKHWVSLGEAHSLISPKDADPEKGIPADFIRVSAGLENSGDLIADLEQAFSKVRW